MSEQGQLMEMLLKMVLLAGVVFAAPSRVKRSGGGAAKYDNQIDAGIRGEGDLEHRDGLFVGYDAVNGYLVFKNETSADTEWKFTSDNRWVHLADDKCVHPEGGSQNPPDETRLVLVDCDPNNPERIKFMGVNDGEFWNIKHITSGKCVHPLRGTAAVGVKLILWSECGRADRLDYIFEDAQKNKVPVV